MTLSLAPKQGDLLGSTVGYCEGRVAPDSIYEVLQADPRSSGSGSSGRP